MLGLRNTPVPLLAALALAVAGCGPSAETRAADRAEIEALVAGYVERLTEAYRSDDPSGLAEVSTEREIARVGERLRELSVDGRGLRPVLRRQVVEEVDLFGATSASATTIEVWDLRIIALGSEETVAESLEQENRVVYTLRKERGHWQILARLLKSSTESP